MKTAIPATDPSSSRTRMDVLLGLLLTLAVLTAYGSVRHYPFVNFDDPVYVAENPWVNQGLNRKSVAWAFRLEDKTTTYWHPLTWLSHMLDCELFGLDAGAHHMTNVWLHIFNSLLVMGFFRWTTGQFWPSFMVAALFALHPINVESVAWVASRKTLLSTFCWMLLLVAYARYAVRPSPGRYAAVIGILALGLTAKPMLVTLPFVLLLLDVWPLGRLVLAAAAGSRPQPTRFQEAPPGRLMLEKLPLVLLAGFSVFMSLTSLQGKSNVADTVAVPLGLRMANALVSYPQYLQKLFWPADLAVFYPYPQDIPAVAWIAALVGLAAATAASLARLRTQPYLAVGWCWFLGTLLPVSGLVQIGLWPAMADRFAYVPALGIFAATVWYAAGVPVFRPRIKVLAAAVLLAALAWTTRVQTTCWSDSIRLFRHAASVTAHNHVAHNNLGVALEKKRMLEQAVIEFKKALAARPDYADAHYNLGFIAAERGQLRQARRYLRRALELQPDFARAHLVLGNTHLAIDDFSSAVNAYRAAVEASPDYREAHLNWGAALLASGRPDLAVPHLQRVLDIDGADVNAHFNLGLAMAAMGRRGMAKAHLQMVLAIDPSHERARQELRKLNSAKPSRPRKAP